MDGSATLTTDTSRMTMNWATQARTSVGQSARVSWSRVMSSSVSGRFLRTTNGGLRDRHALGLGSGAARLAVAVAVGHLVDVAGDERPLGATAPCKEALLLRRGGVVSVHGCSRLRKGLYDGC